MTTIEQIALADRERSAEGVPMLEVLVRGVTHLAEPEPVRQQMAEAFTRRLVGALGPHERVTLEYVARPAVDARVQMRIAVEGRDGFRPQADLRRLLACDAGFAFDRAASVGRPEHERRSVLPAPAAIVTGGRMARVGFDVRARAVDHHAVSALSPVAWLAPRGIDAAITALAAQAPGASLTLELSPLPLTGEPIDQLASLLDAWSAGALLVFEAGEWVDPDAATADAIAATLRGWLSGCGGIRLTLSAGGSSSHSHAPLRHALADDSCPAWTNRLMRAAIVPALSLDLAGCFPLDLPLPRLMPTCDSALRLLGPNLAAPEPARMPRNGARLGLARVGADAVPVRLADRDRGRHLLLVGASGTGKSTMMTHAALSDLSRGQGACVIDPHGELTKSILARVPIDREDDVLWLRPGLDEQVFGLSLLEYPEDERDHAPTAIANELIRIFGRLYDLHLVGGPMFEQYFRAALILVIDNDWRPGSLVDVVRVFEDPRYRRHLVTRCRNRRIAEFWERVAQPATGEASMASMAPYITSKLNRFVSGGLTRAILGQTFTTFDFGEALDGRRILLFDLSVGGLGVADVQLLGMLVLSKIYLHAMRRTSAGRRDAAPVHVFVDEAQLFANETLVESVAQGRKGGARLVLATQNLGQLRSERHGERIVQTVVANAGSVAAFRLNSQDAEALEGVFGGRFSRQDLQALPDFSAATRLLVDGRPLPPFVTYVPRLEEPARDCDERIARIRLGARRYSVRLADVRREMESPPMEPIED